MTSSFTCLRTKYSSLHSCRFSTEFLNDNQNLIPGGFVQKVLLRKTSNRDPAEMELKTTSGLALQVHSAGNQQNLINIASGSYFAKEKIILVVYYLSVLLIRKKCGQKTLCQPFKIFLFVHRAHLNNYVYSYLSIFHGWQYPLAA